MHRLTAAACGALLLVALPVAAGDGPGVESMNYPAWLLRNYQTLPLAVGTELKPGDLIRTGEGGRVRVALAGGGTFDLGGASRLLIASLAAGSAAKPAARLQVLRGVFRLDATQRGTADDTQALEIGIGELGVRARAADFWGRSDARQNLVCLMRGTLRVQGGDGGATELKQALSCFVKPRQRAPLPVDVVDAEQHRLWIAESGPDAAAGIAAAGGQWQLVLASFEDGAGAGRELERLRAAGYAARRRSVVRRGRDLHRLLLPGFVSAKAALAARDRIARDLGIADAWVWRTD